MIKIKFLVGGRHGAFYPYAIVGKRTYFIDTRWYSFKLVEVDSNNNEAFTTRQLTKVLKDNIGLINDPLAWKEKKIGSTTERTLKIGKSLNKIKKGDYT